MSELTDLCRHLVQFPSFNGQTEEISVFLKDYFTNIGFKTRFMVFSNNDGKKVTNLCAQYGTGQPHLLFAGHFDVVPTPNPSDWLCPPFAAVIKNGKIYGRGIADMKGGVACFAEACKEFIATYRFAGKITIILSGDEEEPIVDGTKMMLQTLYREGEIFDFALVGEPSNPQTMGDEIKIGRRGDIVFKITSHGKSGHTAYLSPTDNPVHNLVTLLNKLQTDKLDDGNAYFAPSSLQITTIDVGNPASNVVPSEATATLDIRFNSEHNFTSIESWLNNHIRNTVGTFTVKSEHIGESFLCPLNNHVELLQDIIARHTGKTPLLSTAGGTSDARFVKDYCPVIEYGLTNGTIHKTNECETLQNIETLCAIYKEFLEKFF